MLRKIRLYGELAKFVGHRVLHADVKNAAEAIRFLVVNWPELEKHMAERYYKVAADEWEIVEDELSYPVGASDIKIIPVIGGAGGNTGRIVLGIVLIGAAFAFPGFAFAGITAGNIGMMGAALVLGGIASMLSPIEDVPETDQDPRRSFAFSGITNTSKAGCGVPVIFGKCLVGSVVISAGIDTVQVEA